MAERIGAVFDRELEQVRSKVLDMGALAIQQLAAVVQALQHGGDWAAIVAADEVLNRLEVEIDDACQTIIVRRQPAAGDLRFVLAVSRILADLERIGDEVKKIALAAQALFDGQTLPAGALHGTLRLAESGVPMLNRALAAFAELDASAWRQLREADGRLDRDYRAQARTLLTYMMEQPQQVGLWVDIMMMNKSLERVGDHAKNVAEHVVYLVRGIDVRHGFAEAV